MTLIHVLVKKEVGHNSSLRLYVSGAHDDNLQLVHLKNDSAVDWFRAEIISKWSEVREIDKITTLRYEIFNKVKKDEFVVEKELFVIWFRCLLQNWGAKLFIHCVHNSVLVMSIFNLNRSS
jgi:hypothetical protein